LKGAGISDFGFFLVLGVKKGYIRLKKLGFSNAFEIFAIVELNRGYDNHKFLEFLHINQNLFTPNVLNIRNNVFELLKMKGFELKVGVKVLTFSNLRGICCSLKLISQRRGYILV